MKIPDFGRSFYIRRALPLCLADDLLRRDLICWGISPVFSKMEMRLTAYHGCLT